MVRNVIVSGEAQESDALQRKKKSQIIFPARHKGRVSRGPTINKKEGPNAATTLAAFFHRLCQHPVDHWGRTKKLPSNLEAFLAQRVLGRACGDCVGLVAAEMIGATMGEGRPGLRSDS